MTDVRTATPADLPRVCESLCKAFWDDPVMSHLLPDGVSGRERRLRGLMRMEATGALRHASVWTTDDGAANAIWKPPGAWRVGARELIKQTPQAFRSLRLGLPRALAVLSTIEKKHPKEPHWYLAVLGTEPAAQGRGRGSAVMQPVLDRCDAEGIPAYLESSKEANIPFYERHGFRVTEAVGFPRGGPSVWLMWREPRPRS